MTTAGTALSPTSALPDRGTRTGRRPRSRLRVVGLRLRDAFIVLFIVMMTIFFLGSVVGCPEEQLVSQDATPELRAITCARRFVDRTTASPALLKASSP